MIKNKNLTNIELYETEEGHWLTFRFKAGTATICLEEHFPEMNAAHILIRGWAKEQCKLAKIKVNTRKRQLEE